jgi:hypothetical protein
VEPEPSNSAVQAPPQIFISYARDDDEPPPDDPGAKGFVTYLHDQLRYELRQLGQPWPELWRDRQKIERSNQFEPRLSEALARSSLLLVILSRNWMNRDWCLRELEEFTKQFSNEDEWKLRERIIVVGKNEVDRAKRPRWIQGQECYNLFWNDSETSKEVDFFVRGKIVDARYLDRLRELARDVWSKARQEPPSRPNGRPSRADPTGRSVFLARPAPDMVQAYDTLVCELAGRGYRVVPDPATELPKDRSEAIELVDQALATAELSVHLLGKHAGLNVQRSVGLQLTRAAARVGQAVSEDPLDLRRFHRVIWAPRTLLEQGIADRDAAKVLATFGDCLETDKVVADNLVELSQFLIQHLEANAPRPSRVAADPGNGTRVYVQHLEADADYALDLAERLQEAGLSALLPAFDGDETDRNLLHLRQLADCDAVVLCWASASEVWIRSNANELKWDRLGRDRPFYCRGVVAGPPPREPKNRFRRIPPRSDIDLVIDATAASSPPPDALQPLLQMITSHAQ